MGSNTPTGRALSVESGSNLSVRIMKGRKIKSLVGVSSKHENTFKESYVLEVEYQKPGYVYNGELFPSAAIVLTDVGHWGKVRRHPVAHKTPVIAESI